MIWYGHGFTWTELYTMPVWLRKYYYRKVEEAMEKEHKAAEKASRRSSKVSKPNIAPR